jgi:predicted amidophosphoribosyltransferase
MAESEPFFCPQCTKTTSPAARVGAIAICNSCGASLLVDVVDAGGVLYARRATFKDVEHLNNADVATLRHARGAIARAK